MITFFVVLTKARTAYAMLCGILFLFSLAVILRLRGHWKKLLATLAVCLVTFNMGVQFLGYAAARQNKADVTAQAVLEDNLLSLNSDVKRSNGARYALIRSNMRIAMQHPVLGVGRGLAGAYMIDNYTEEEAKNSEIADWVRRSKKYGLFANGQGYSDAMNEFVTRLSQTGAIGLLVFLAPFALILYKLQQPGTSGLVAKQLLFTVILSSLAAGCNGSVNLMYGVWIFLGLAYAAVYGDSKEE